MDLDLIATNLSNGIQYAAIISSTYVLALGAINLLASRNSKAICSQNELEEAVAEELLHHPDTENRTIMPVFNWENCANYLEKGVFELNATSQYLVRHELCHILDGHNDDGTYGRKKGIGKIMDLISYLAYYEPKAAIASLAQPQHNRVHVIKN